ncbi:MAG: Maf family protein [Leptospirales bacterium]
MIPENIEFILASASARRSELLTQMGELFTVKPANCDETVETSGSIRENAARLAKKKADYIADHIDKPSLVIGADTLVSVDGKILGQPKNREHSVQMLKLLSGKIHEVTTGVCLVGILPNYSKSFYTTTKVEFNILSDEEIERYVNTDEPADKAGAYAIQGKAAVFVREIHGDYYNVVGLPLSKLYHELKLYCKYLKTIQPA